MRKSPIYYIAPSSISVTPNANGSQNDLAVYIASGTKIKIYCPKVGLTTGGTTFQEWTLKGRNRSLDDAAGTKEYTIYARLPKADKKSGYLVFCPKTQYGDKYKYLSLDTDDGLAPVGSNDKYVVSENYWYMRLGDVSLPKNGLRTVTLDTGVLGTDEFNTEWALSPEALPLRVELSCTVDDEDVGLNPYVYWEQSLRLVASLVEGWSGTDITRFDHWEISRNSGDSNADADWLTSVRKNAFSESGEIILSHARDNDDFNGAVAATFTVMAMEKNPEYVEGSTTIPPFLLLRSATITVHAETVEKYELALATAIVSYNPQTDSYSPSNGVEVRIRANDQRGDVYELTNKQYADAGLRGYYAPVGSAFPQTPNLIFSGSDDEVAVTVIPVSAFSGQQSINVRLANAEGTELMLETIAFVRDGEDSKEREWIYRKNTQEGYANTTGTANGQPVSGQTGNVYNCYLIDDFVPEGWTDDPSGVTSAGDIEYTAYRDFDKTLKRWGAFQQPKIWTRYGADGADGTIMQRMYISNNSSVWSGALPTDYVDDPSGWRTSPTPVTSSARYRWLTERISNDGGSTWGSGWSTPQIDTYLAEDGTSISIKGSADGVIEWGQDIPVGIIGGTYLMNNGDSDNVEVFVMDDWSQMIGHWEGYSAEIGDCYIVDTHLFICEREYALGVDAPAWKDLGQIKGEDGTSPYFADIENEMDSVPCDNEGYTTSAYDKYIGVNLWHGSTAIAISSLTTTSATGLTITPDANNKRFRVQVQSDVQIAEVNNITISLSGSGSGNHILHFVLNGVRSGEPGQSATVFSLLPSVSAIKRNKNGTLTPASPMTCDVLKKVGNADAIRATSSDGTLRYRVDGDITNFQEGTAIDINTKAVPYYSGYKYITFAFFVGTTLVDKERVHIVYDGEDGTSPYFADIENEMDSVPCDNEGYTTSAYDKYIGVNLWHGSTAIAISSLTTTSATGLTITPDANNKRFRVQVQSDVQIAEVNNITISLSGSGSGNHILHFVLNGVRSGEPGQSATVFSLLPSVSAIKRNKNGTLTPASPMTCDVLKKVGNADAIRATSSDGTLRYRVDGDITNFQEGTAIDINTKAVPYYSGYKYITFAFFVGTTLVDKERVPIVYDGEDGDDAPYNVYAYARYDSRAGDATTGAPTGNIDTSVGNSGWASQAPSPVSSYPYIWQRIQHYTSAGTLDITSYVCLTGAPGVDGGRGHTGRFYYYAGDYSSDGRYRIEATQAPYVRCNGTFFMLDYKGEELPYEPWPSDGRPGAPSSAASNPWTQMASEQQYYIARAFFGENAYLGSFIINGDWMISQYGTYKPDANTTIVVNGDNILTYPTAYTHFKAADPLAEGTAGYPCFAPNFAVDGLTGETYQQNAYLQGEVHATSGVFQDVKISGGIRSPFTYVEHTFNNDYSDHITLLSEESSLVRAYELPWDNSQSGRRLLVANYKWKSGTQDASGYVSISAPTGKYFFEDGKKRAELRLSREIVELIGYGDPDEFYGWIVLTRTNLGTKYSYGHDVKALAMGTVSWSDSNMVAKGMTFDGSGLTCTHKATGIYEITFGNTEWFRSEEDVFVLLTGYGSTDIATGKGNQVYANLYSKSTTGFEVRLADDASLNDGGFNFVVMNSTDWASLTQAE